MSPVRAVLLDALGTLVELSPPAPRLRRALLEKAGVDIGAEVAECAFEAEISYYLDHHLEGGDQAGLERLRDGCARVMLGAIGTPALDFGAVRGAMLTALQFTAFRDAAPALQALRGRGLRLVAVSNWDCSLRSRLDEAGVGGLLDGAVASAEVGEAKPAPTVFAAALEMAGVSAAEALHVGDSLLNDVQGARAAGIRAVLLARDGDPPRGVEHVRSLNEIASLV